jgi:hypothetical protein
MNVVIANLGGFRALAVSGPGALPEQARHARERSTPVLALDLVPPAGAMPNAQAAAE